MSQLNDYLTSEENTLCAKLLNLKCLFLLEVIIMVFNKTKEKQNVNQSKTKPSIVDFSHGFSHKKHYVNQSKIHSPIAFSI